MRRAAVNVDSNVSLFKCLSREVHITCGGKRYASPLILYVPKHSEATCYSEGLGLIFSLVHRRTLFFTGHMTIGV